MPKPAMVIKAYDQSNNTKKDVDKGAVEKKQSPENNIDSQEIN